MARHLFPRRTFRRAVALLPLLALLLLPLPAAAAGPLVQTVQLTPTGATGQANFGVAVTMSQDGTTALVGAWQDDGTGAAYVYMRSGSIWTQQGGKLTGAGITGVEPDFGFSVALSADGNTALIGAVGESNAIGAAYVFTRSGGVWAQQGGKLTVSDTAGCPSFSGVIDCQFGWTVALSGDGNTALVCAYYSGAYLFTRTGATWTQQQILTRSCGGVALSADGNTALVGLGGSGGSDVGTAAVFIRMGTTWSQQQVLMGTCGRFVSACYFGRDSVALSADGNTALIGARGDNGLQGSAFVYTRGGSVWTQQGSKLTVTGSSILGISVALSGDGNTALLGSPAVAYLFTRAGGTWNLQQTVTPVGGGQPSEFGWSVRLSGDATTAIGGDWVPTNQNLAGTAYIFANPRTLASIALSGTTPLKVGQVVQFAATGKYTDTTTGPLLWGTWQSSNPTVATVDASGNVTGQTAGTATITYTLDGVVGQTMVTVVAPTPIGLSVPPAPQIRPSGTTGGSGLPSPAPASRPAPSAAPAGSTTGPTPNPAPPQR